MSFRRMRVTTERLARTDEMDIYYGVSLPRLWSEMKAKNQRQKSLDSGVRRNDGVLEEGLWFRRDNPLWLSFVREGVGVGQARGLWDSPDEGLSLRVISDEGRRVCRPRRDHHLQSKIPRSANRRLPLPGEA